MAETALDECDGPCLHTPYVRGDVTGLQRRNVLGPVGIWSTVMEGCAEETTWARVVLDADLPAGTSLEASVRTADTLDALGRESWIAVGTAPEDGTDLDVRAALEAADVPPGRYLGLQIQFQGADGELSPVLRGVTVLWGCPGDLE